MGGPGDSPPHSLPAKSHPECQGPTEGELSSKTVGTDTAR